MVCYKVVCINFNNTTSTWCFCKSDSIGAVECKICSFYIIYKHTWCALNSYTCCKNVSASCGKLIFNCPIIDVHCASIIICSTDNNLISIGTGYYSMTKISCRCSCNSVNMIKIIFISYTNRNNSRRSCKHNIAS